MLESSNIDGGSSIAVLTYLRHILDSIEQPELIQSILEYLFGAPKQSIELKSAARPVTLARRRKSENLIKVNNHHAQKHSPELFTLLDLITIGLRSSSQQMTRAVLQLCSLLLGKHHLYASGLVKTRYILIKDETPKYAEHIGWTDKLLSMAEEILSCDSLERSYENHLHDARNLLENHPCSTSAFTIPDFPGFDIESTWTALPVADSQLVRPRSIVKEDPFLGCLVVLMKRFFSNDIETNLALTQVLVDLSSCGLVGLGSWLLKNPQNHESADNDSFLATGKKDVATSFEATISEDNSDTVAPDTLSIQEPLESMVDGLSPIFAALDLLVDQVDWYRKHVQNFTEYLQNRRESLAIDAESHTAADAGVTLQKSADSKTPSTSGHRQIEGNSSVSSNSMPDKRAKPVSRSASVRGRQQYTSTLSTTTLLGHLSHLQILPSQSPSQSTSRTYSPSPLRNSTIPSNSRKPTDPSKDYPPELRHKIKLINEKSRLQNGLREAPCSETSSIQSEHVNDGLRIEEIAEVTIGHLLTNVIILQEFILELTAVIQVRATLFNEVRLT